MSEELITQAREALLRAIPHLSKLRQEIIVDFLMTGKFREPDWYSFKHSQVLDPETKEIRIQAAGIMFDLYTEFDYYVPQFIDNLNKAIDDYEHSRNLQDGKGVPGTPPGTGP